MFPYLSVFSVIENYSHLIYRKMNKSIIIWGCSEGLLLGGHTPAWIEEKPPKQKTPTYTHRSRDHVKHGWMDGKMQKPIGLMLSTLYACLISYNSMLWFEHNQPIFFHKVSERVESLNHWINHMRDALSLTNQEFDKKYQVNVLSKIKQQVTPSLICSSVRIKLPYC